MNFDAILFDGDGVVFDSEELSILAFRLTLEQHGIFYARHECGRFIGRGTAELLDEIGREKGCAIELERYVRERDDVYEQCCRDINGPHLLPGATDLLAWLETRRIPYAMASSASPRKLEWNLSRTGLTSRFTTRVNGDEITRGKPAPDIFIEAARRLGVDIRRCLVVEDSVNGLKGAIAGGATPIGIEGSHHRDELAVYTKRIYRSLAGLLEALNSPDFLNNS